MNNRNRYPRRRRRTVSKSSTLIKLAVYSVALIAVVALLLTGIVKLFGSSEDATPAVENNVVYKTKTDIPSAKDENDLVKIAKNAKGSSQKVCYLTFDDGPTKEVTPKVLDVLNQYNVKATFFCLGKILDQNKDVAKREFDEGHLIANHSYNHDYDDLYESSKSFMNEIFKCEDKIREITGEEPFKLMRFPGGSYNAGDHAEEKQVYKKVLKENDYYYADWNCLNGDAEAALRSVDELVSNVKKSAEGDAIVVLMHDAATKTTTPEALGQIIEYLRSQGYEFKRLDEIKYHNDGSDGSSMIL